MYTDQNLRVSDAQVVTATASSTSSIDLSAINRDLGPGFLLKAVITVDETATAAGAATVGFQIVHDADAALATPNVLRQTFSYPKANLTAGRDPIVLEVGPVPPDVSESNFRYLGIRYFVSTGPLTAGKFTANFVIDHQEKSRYYPSGFSIESP